MDSVASRTHSPIETLPRSALLGSATVTTEASVLIEAVGLLNERVTMAHGIWVTDSDVEVLADRRVSVSHNPISNLKLGSGIAPWRKYLDAGVNLKARAVLNAIAAAETLSEP